MADDDNSNNESTVDMIAANTTTSNSPEINGGNRLLDIVGKMVSLSSSPGNSARPATPEEAREVLDEWFGRYRPDPDLLDQEVERHFAGVPPSRSPRSEIPRVLES